MVKKITVISAGIILVAGCAIAIILSQKASPTNTEEAATKPSPITKATLSNTDDTFVSSEMADTDNPDKPEEESPSTNNNAVTPSERTAPSVAQSEPQESPQTKNTDNSRSETVDTQAQTPENTTDDEQTQHQIEEAARLRALNEAHTMISSNPNKGDYPYAKDCPEQQDAFPDPWGMNVCESVSYAAWKVERNYGNMPYWSGMGNASQWPANARSRGIPVGTVPKIGSVGISTGGYYGHAVWVEDISEDQTMVYVSQYNMQSAATNYSAGEYSEQWMPADSLIYIYFGEYKY